jgi:Acyl-CoA synthetases (AMP-forming)/AMP-acid ligases II
MILNLDKCPKDSIAAIDSCGNFLKYGDILLFSKKMESLIPSRSLLFILTENNIGGINWIIGSINSGNVPLILNSHIEEELFLNLLSIYTPSYICVPSSMVNSFSYDLVYEQYGYSLLKTNTDYYDLNIELSHLLPTSGSTGSPKLVRHKYENIEASALNISTFFDLKSSDRPLLVLPLYYTMGLSIVFSHLYVGATILITDLSMTDRKFWLFLKGQKATSFTGVPYSFEILDLMRFYKMDLPDLTLLTQGGGKMSYRLNMKFAEYCRDNGKQWIATYGQSECTARMAYLPPEYAISKCGSIGISVPNGELSLIDTNGEIIKDPDINGEMCYKGKNVTMGYASCKEDLLLGDECNGFMRTGDIAYRDDDGFYYIVGRKGRFLKLFGMRIGLDDCEQIVKRNYQIECVCVGTDEKMKVFITDDK